MGGACIRGRAGAASGGVDRTARGRGLILTHRVAMHGGRRPQWKSGGVSRGSTAVFWARALFLSEHLLGALQASTEDRGSGRPEDAGAHIGVRPTQNSIFFVFYSSSTKAHFKRCIGSTERSLRQGVDTARQRGGPSASGLRRPRRGMAVDGRGGTAEASDPVPGGRKTGGMGCLVRGLSRRASQVRVSGFDRIYFLYFVDHKSTFNLMVRCVHAPRQDVLVARRMDGLGDSWATKRGCRGGAHAGRTGCWGGECRKLAAAMANYWDGRGQGDGKTGSMVKGSRNRHGEIQGVKARRNCGHGPRQCRMRNEGNCGVTRCCLFCLKGAMVWSSRTHIQWMARWTNGRMDERPNEINDIR